MQVKGTWKITVEGRATSPQIQICIWALWLVLLCKQNSQSLNWPLVIEKWSMGCLLFWMMGKFCKFIFLRPVFWTTIQWLYQKQRIKKSGVESNTCFAYLFGFPWGLASFISLVYTPQPGKVSGSLFKCSSVQVAREGSADVSQGRSWLLQVLLFCCSKRERAATFKKLHKV